MTTACTAPMRPYTFLELTRALCSQCLQVVDAKLILQHDHVYMLKQCRSHPAEKVLIATDYDYWRQTRQFLKPGQMPQRWNTETLNGCPYDCGLCPDHEQHSCVTLLEITDRCNLTCPTCFAGSSPTAGSHRTLAQVEAMLDAIVANEGEPDVVQLSGGEPTIHPQFFEILDAAKARPIKHLMINTNGVRLAKDPDFAARLAKYGPGFEVYLQFDSLSARPQEVLRGDDLREVRQKALDHLNAVNLSTTLVCVVRKGLNDGELGDILRFAQAQRCVRGVTFQPVQEAGRTEDYTAATDRLTLTEVRAGILAQYEGFTAADIIPVPCHPDGIAMGYALKHEGRVVPLSRFIDPARLLVENGPVNTIRHEVRDKLLTAFALNHSPESGGASVGSLLCCLPELDVPESLGYESLFRVLIIDFMDVRTMDVRSVKRSCIHIVHPETLKIIPFDTYNLFYRPGLSLPAFATAQPGPAVVGRGCFCMKSKRNLSLLSVLALLSATLWLLGIPDSPQSISQARMSSGVPTTPEPVQTFPNGWQLVNPPKPVTLENVGLPGLFTVSVATLPVVADLPAAGVHPIATVLNRYWAVTVHPDPVKVLWNGHAEVDGQHQTANLTGLLTTQQRAQLIRATGWGQRVKNGTATVAHAVLSIPLTVLCLPAVGGIVRNVVDESSWRKQTLHKNQQTLLLDDALQQASQWTSRIEALQQRYNDSPTLERSDPFYAGNTINILPSREYYELDLARRRVRYQGENRPMVAIRFGFKQPVTVGEVEALLENSRDSSLLPMTWNVSYLQPPYVEGSLYREPTLAQKAASTLTECSLTMTDQFRHANLSCNAQPGRTAP